MLAKKIGESFVPYFTCHAATFEGGVEKPVFSTVLQQPLESKKCNVWVLSAFLKSCNVADKCWQKKLARVSFHTSPAMLLLLKGMLKKPVFHPPMN